MAAPHPAARAETLRLLTNNNPPFSIVDAQGQVTGISADIVIEMARRAAVPVTMEHYPWSRAFDDALHDPDACIFSASRLPEREVLLKWIGPIASNSWALFARSDFNTPMPDLDAAHGLVIGGQTQDAKSVYLAARGLTVDALADDDLNPRRLKEGRIDLWVTGLYTGRMKAAERGVSGLKPFLVFRKVDSYLACNPAVPRDVFDRLLQAFDAMRTDGTARVITRHYVDLMDSGPAD